MLYIPGKAAAETAPPLIHRKPNGPTVHRTVMMSLHMETLSVFVVLYHCLLKELPHIYTANSLLLMQLLKDKSSFPLFLDS